MYVCVCQGILPSALELVNDPDIRSLILNCLSRKEHRPSPTDLLNSPFLKANVPGLVQISKSSDGACALDTSLCVVLCGVLCCVVCCIVVCYIVLYCVVLWCIVFC